MAGLRTYLVVILILLTCSMVSAQDSRDKTAIYRLVLQEYMDSAFCEHSFPLAVIDSTRPAVFYGGFPDDINMQYFGFSDQDLKAFDNFRMEFVEATKRAEEVHEAVFLFTNTKQVSALVFRKAFAVKRKGSKILITDRGFRKFQLRSGCKAFCEFSIPYFLDGNTAIVYFNFRCSADTGWNNVYICSKKNGNWIIAAKLRPWEM